MAEDQLNKDAIIENFKNMTFKDVCVAELTSKWLNCPSNKNATWNYLLARDFDINRHVILDDGVSSKDIYIEEDRCRQFCLAREYSLFEVCKSGGVHHVRCCVRRGADINSSDTKPLKAVTALHNSCYNSHRDVTLLLIKMGADLEKTDAFGWTPLMYACKWSTSKKVRLLLNSGAQVYHGMLPYTNSTKSMRALMEHGAMINKVDDNGSTALIKAAWSGNEKMVRFLLYNGANPNIENNFGATAIFCAIIKNNLEIQYMLMKNGAL